MFKEEINWIFPRNMDPDIFKNGTKISIKRSFKDYSESAIYDKGKFYIECLGPTGGTDVTDDVEYVAIRPTGIKKD